MTYYTDINKGVEGLRFAVPSDEEDIFNLLLMLHNENGIFSVNPQKVRAGIQYATQRQGGLIFVNEGPRVVATLGLAVAMEWYTDEEYLCERWNYVHPEHRRSNYARMLLEQAKWVSDWFASKGKKLPLQIGINSCERTEAKVRLYARHLPCIGAYFVYGEATQKAFDHGVRERAKEVEQTNLHNGRTVPLVKTILRASAGR